MTAYVIAPVAPPPEVWLGSLLGGIQFPGDGAINRIMAAISNRIEAIDDAAPDPSNIAARLVALTTDDWYDWCSGFHALVTAAPRAWPARSLAADDKRILRALADAAEGDPDPGLSSVLPAWIAGRHARRK